MRRALPWVLSAALAVPALGADVSVPPLPPVDAPLAASPAPAAAFPLRTAGEFFSGARRIVDLGGETLSRWTLDAARRNPAAEVHVVNLKAGPPLDAVQKAFAAPNLRESQYDFFSPPESRPTGDRVVLNSPNFGGLPDAKAAERFAELVDAHLEPGGVFYMHADDLWLASLEEMLLHARLGRSIEPRLRERREAALAALRARFGAENVAVERLEGYDPQAQLNAPESHVLQVRKPSR